MSTQASFVVLELRRLMHELMLDVSDVSVTLSPRAFHVVEASLMKDPAFQTTEAQMTRRADQITVCGIVFRQERE